MDLFLLHLPTYHSDVDFSITWLARNETNELWSFVEVESIATVMIWFLRHMWLEVTQHHETIIFNQHKNRMEEIFHVISRRIFFNFIINHFVIKIVQVYTPSHSLIDAQSRNMIKSRENILMKVELAMLPSHSSR